MEAFKILCLGGGGIKGIMHIGALEELEKEVGLLHKHFSKGIYGCSVGSLIATSIAFGITPQQIKKIYNKISNFKKLVDMNDLTKIQNILNNKGIFSMTKFENILIKLFNSAKAFPLSSSLTGFKISSTDTSAPFSPKRIPRAAKANSIF